MRRYETIVISDPDLSDEKRDSFFDRIKEIIDQQNGFLIEFDEWGSRKLAYEIRKKIRGYYLRVDYCGTGDVVNEMERFFRIDDRALKYMTIQLEKQADVQAIKDAMAASTQQESMEDEAQTQEEPEDEKKEIEDKAVETEKTEEDN